MTKKLVPIERILPNPYQPESRKQIPEEVAAKFGNSILLHGLLQLPVVRCAEQDNFYEMGDGGLRLAGYRWLVQNGHPDFASIPVEVRALSNQQMADLVMEANMVRKDLTPIDEATLYKRYLDDFHVTETELAKLHNLSQGEVANTIRLLTLPQNIQAKVSSGELPRTHARQLLRLNLFPALQTNLLEMCLKTNTSVKELSNSIAATLYQNSQSLAQEGYNSPRFNTQECLTCEWRQKIGSPYSSREAEWRCLNPECWNKKEEKALTEIRAKALAEVQQKVKDAKVIPANTLKMGEYTQLTEYEVRKLDQPQECENCARRLLMESRYQPGGVALVCTDMKCFRRKQIRRTREQNRLFREKDAQLTTQLGKVANSATRDRTTSLRVATEILLRRATPEVRADVASIFNFPLDKKDRPNILLLTKALIDKGLDDLLKVLIAAALSIARREIGKETILRKSMASLDGTYADFLQRLTDFQEKNCRGCDNCDDELIGTGEECCKWVYQKQVDENGICRGRRVKETKQQEILKDSRELLPPQAREPVTAVDRELETIAIEEERKRT